MTSRTRGAMLQVVAPGALCCTMRNPREAGRVADNWVGGTWVSAHAGGRREIRCPADGSLVAEVDESGPEDTAAAIAAARDAFDSGPWPGTPARERGDLLLRLADSARARHRHHRQGRVARHRQAPGRERVRRRRHRVGRPALRPHRRRRGRPDGRHRQPRCGQPHRARAGRRLRPDHAVELPAAPGLLEDRALPRRRQHVRPQAQRAHAAHRDPPDEAARRGRASPRAWPTSCSATARTPAPC